ncbi:ferritin [Jonquetella sp. BV3C21]|uniref:ferritin n=1 Tax=Jonquetella sp. BV3C21 TaxID=1111126 RepID=UPI0003ADE257|nr:ferritin [Jonquetella sp. BV3C21]ERL24745.1 ferritin-like protein [Jonquetella sp. BV3C21]
MKLSDKLYKALNDQVNAEMYSAYLYQSMASWLTAQELPGMAGWMAHQAKEEMEHAFKIYHYIESRGEQPKLTAIEGPKTSWESALAVFEQALGHERHVSDLIASIIKLAREEEDFATETLMSWYINEQVEEEANATRNVHAVSLGKGDAGKLHLLDAGFVRHE